MDVEAAGSGPAPGPAVQGATAGGAPAASSLPGFQELLGPVLDLLDDGAERTRRQAAAGLADALGLPPDRRVGEPAAGYGPLEARIQWAVTYLGQACCLERPRRGVYRITDRGRELRAARPRDLGLADLEQYPEYRDFQGRRRARPPSEPAPAAGHLTPVEQIAAAVAEVEAAAAAELLAQVRAMPPEFLERAVLRLLVAMGYGGNEGVAEHLGGPGDGGFDGVVDQDRLGLQRVYVQAKRYGPDDVVGRPAVQGFVGALHGIGAAGGVFVTTSRFSPEAVAFAAGIKPRVVLVDGQRLGALMVRHGVGVQATQRFTVVEVDEDFFE